MHASVLDGPDGGGHGEVAVVVEAASPDDFSPIMEAAYALTPRKREIVACLSRGLDTGEIAARLFLSPHTVRDHIKSVFEKVGVRTRREVVARIFASVNHIGAHLD